MGRWGGSPQPRHRHTPSAHSPRSQPGCQALGPGGKGKLAVWPHQQGARTGAQAAGSSSPCSLQEGWRCLGPQGCAQALCAHPTGPHGAPYRLEAEAPGSRGPETHTAAEAPPPGLTLWMMPAAWMYCRDTEDQQCQLTWPSAVLLFLPPPCTASPSAPSASGRRGTGFGPHSASRAS